MASDTYEEVRIGPFVGGLNTLSDQTSIQDTELYQMLNFECDKDGSLVSRPPLLQAAGTAIPGTGAGLKLLGYYVDSAGAYYLIASNRVDHTYYYASGTWTVISNFPASACIQFRDVLHLVAPLTSPTNGGTWTPTGGFVVDTDMPKGAAIVSLRDRLWLAQGVGATSNGSQVYVSGYNSTGSFAWKDNAKGSLQFINVSNGDGQNVVDLAVLNTDLIVFKQRSTYRFTYSSDLSQGIISQLSPTIGAAATGCYASWDSEMYLLFDGSLFTFSNYVFNKINDTVPFKATNPSTSLTEYFSISAWAGRIFISFWDRLYVYSTITRTWCEWESDRWNTIGRFFPTPVNQGVYPTAYFYSTQALGTSQGKLLGIIQDSFDSVAASVNDPFTTEQYACSFVTKNYDYQTPSKFKRLRFWGADILSRSDLTVKAMPVGYGQAALWSDLAPYTWGALNTAGGTWARPLDVNFEISDSVVIKGLTGGRKWVKFLKSLRFRQIAFSASVTVDGTSATLPTRVFNLTTYVKEKQLVPRKIN